jgi:hypothetical protein
MATTNDDRAVRQRRVTVAVAIVCLAVALTVVYVLASGPAFGFVFAGKMKRDTFDLWFAPLVWLSDHSPGALRLIHWYWQWVISTYFAPPGPTEIPP